MDSFLPSNNSVPPTAVHLNTGWLHYFSSICEKVLQIKGQTPTGGEHVRTRLAH